MKYLIHAEEIAEYEADYPATTRPTWEALEKLVLLSDRASSLKPLEETRRGGGP